MIKEGAEIKIKQLEKAIKSAKNPAIKKELQLKLNKLMNSEKEH